MNRVIAVQRLENGALALAAFAATIWLYPSWWWVPLAAFLLFDLSMVGYVRSTAVGAITYNAVHSYVGPAAAAAVAVVLLRPAPDASTVLGLLACAWAFHVGVDRALGYGLKHADAFTHTHLGRIGKDRRTDVGGRA